MAAFAAGVAVGALIVGALAFAWARGRVQMLGRFLSFAAHEINTPITAINMTVLNLLSGIFGPMPPDQTPWVEMMREQVGRLNGMVGELRDLVHLEFNRNAVLRAESASISEVVDTAVRAVKHGLAHAGIELKVESIPETGSLEADPDRITRTLISLLFHARKFRLSGPIILGARSAQNFVDFSVRFEGPELSSDEAARSLELYYPATKDREHTMTATGLGLGILRLVLRRQAG